MTDRLLVAVTKDGALRARAASTSGLIREGLIRHLAGPGSALALARALSTIAVYPMEWKHNERVTVQWQGQGDLKTILAVFWIALYIFVNLTSVLYLGATALDTIMGDGDGSIMIPCIIGLALFAAAYSLWGGLAAVAWTDVVQVVVLVIGGLVTTFIALSHVAPDGSIMTGFKTILDAVPEKFSMILEKGEIITPNGKDAWFDLPGLAVLLGGMWVANLYYWGFNQYIIQRALAAKSTREAQKGIMFAAFLKMIMPLIIVLPGVAAAILAPDLEAPDRAYPTVMNLLPSGILGLVFAALIAAIVSSLASMMNSISTIFTMDLYRNFKPGEESEGELVRTGRVVSFTAIVIAMIVAKPLLGNFSQAFQYIQEFTGFFTPGVCALFLLGFFWPKTTSVGALLTALGSAVFSITFKLAWPELPFIDRVGIVFLMCIAVGVIVSAIQGAEDHPDAIDYKEVDTRTSGGFNLAALVVILMLTGLYATWW